MVTDILGKQRIKLGLHVHTTRSDGLWSPEQAATVYKNAGFDAIALTDHWVVGKEEEISELRILAGCEYNIGGGDTAKGVYHIVGIGMNDDPKFSKTACAQEIIDSIHKAGGLAVLAHPAWSLNSVEQMKQLRGVDATEIYNTVSGVHASNRPYSGEFVDLAANADIVFPLLATDDTHYYDGEEAVAYIMLDISDGDTSTPSILRKIKAGEFYATMGPEVHLSFNGTRAIVDCSPAMKVSFFSQNAWNRERNTYGDGVTHAEYTPAPFEKWIRAEVTDADGKVAWSNILQIER